MGRRSLAGFVIVVLVALIGWHDPMTARLAAMLACAVTLADFVIRLAHNPAAFR